MTFGLWVVKLEAVVLFMRGSGKNTHIWAYFWYDCMIWIWWYDSNRRFLLFDLDMRISWYATWKSDWIDGLMDWQNFPQDVGKVVTECRCFVASFFLEELISTNGWLLVWIGGLDSWDPLMKWIATLLLRGTLRIPNHQPKPTIIH